MSEPMPGYEEVPGNEFRLSRHLVPGYAKGDDVILSFSAFSGC